MDEYSLSYAGMDTSLIARAVVPRLLEALTDTPVVLIHGPRQCGKSTMARMVGDAHGFTYFSFDEDALRKAALTDPVGFIADLPEHAILDEIQRVPELFTSIKLVVDRDRKPGRFILTGSANIMLVPKLGDSLAGRMEILRLHPLAQAELKQHTGSFFDAFFAGKYEQRTFPRLGEQLAEILVAGGFPAALKRSTPRRQAAWYRDYVEMLVQRDVREMARIGALDALPRLMALMACQTSRLLNVSDLSAPFQLSRPTIRDYVNLLERVFLLDELPAWHSNRLNRLIKSPKLHLVDTGLACALAGVDAAALYHDRALYGQMLETFVFQELRREASARDDALTFYHFRDKDGVEVDLVIESAKRQLAGIEVKASSTVTPADFRGLRKLQAAAGKRFVAGAVIYDGERVLPFGEGLYAVPVAYLWLGR